MSEERISSSEQVPLSFEQPAVQAGSMDDAGIIRGVLLQSIRNSGKSRAAIADEMSFHLARTITEKMLNAFTAESRDDRRWPAEFDRSFCAATGDDTLLRCRAEMAGLHVIDDRQRDLMELGEQYIARQRADEQILLLQQRLNGRSK